MKKILASLLLLMPTIGHSDTLTTAEPHLILISTGAIDRTRSWGDKVNYNFSVISASLTTALAGGSGGGAQSSFAGSKATGAVEMGGFSVNNSSGYTLGTGGKITFPDGTTQNTASVGGGGGTSTMTATYRIVIGTTATWGANVIGNTNNVFTAAISSSNNYGSIFVQRGSYTFSNTVFVPPSISFVFESSAIISHNSNLTLFTLEGELINPQFEIRSFAGAANMIEMKNKGRVNGAYMPNLRLRSNQSMFSIVNTSFCFITNCNVPDGDFTTVGMWFISVDGSTDVYISNNYFNIQQSPNQNVVGIIVQGGKDIYYDRNYLKTVGGNTVYADVSGGKTLQNLIVRNNTFDIDLANTQTNGSLWFANGTGSTPGISSGGIIVDSNIIKIRTASSATDKQAIALFTLGNSLDQCVIKNNTFISTTPLTGLAIQVQSTNISSTVITQNNVINLSNFIVDGGKGTRYLGLNNILNSVPIGHLIDNTYGLFGDSVTFYGTVTSTSGFVGDGTKLTGITASAIQTTPLIAGDTGYSAIYATRTWTATQLFQSSITVSSSMIISGDLIMAATGQTIYISTSDGSSRIGLSFGGMASGDVNVAQSVGIYSVGGAGGTMQFKTGGSFPLAVGNSVVTLGAVTTLVIPTGFGGGVNGFPVIKDAGSNSGLRLPDTLSVSLVAERTNVIDVRKTSTSINNSLTVSSLSVNGTISMSTNGFIVGNSTVTGNLFITGRIIKRGVTEADATSITPNINTTDILTQNNTQAIGTLTINAPTGTHYEGIALLFRLKCTNVQTFSWNGIYRDASGAALPTTTTGGGNTNYYAFIHNMADDKWDYTGSH